MAGMYVICVTSGSGLPVFTRSVGNLKQLPFPVIGSLNAVHMFAANQGAELQSTSTDDAQIVWKSFQDSLVLIAVQCGGGSERHLSRLLELVWAGLVLLCGLEELSNVKNVERFKKDIKVCYPLIDTLMRHADLALFSDVTCTVEGLLASEAAGLQNFLEAFTEVGSSPYGCLMVHGRVVAATGKWWDLSATELVLLSLLMQSFTPCSSRDVPVYLPQLSPMVPHRLLTFSLMSNVDVLTLCGPTPSLAQLEQDVGRFWVPAVEMLHSVRKIHPRNFPSYIDVDHNILGFILINTLTNHSVSSVDLRKDVKNKDEIKRRRSCLRNFYSNITESYFTRQLAEDESSDSSEMKHNVSDAYILKTTHKSYALSSENYQLFVMFSSKIPTYAMKNVCLKTLNALVKDKSVLI